jgi:DNA polymerase-3 subunit epsilon
MILCGIDLETTSLDIETTEVVEVGAVLWDTERQVPLKLLNELMPCQEEISEETTEITGIKAADVDIYGMPKDKVWRWVSWMMKKADYVVGHNVNRFDRPIVERVLQEQNLIVPDKDWLDTYTDMPLSVTPTKLSYMAADMGFLNPFAHRAVFDVLTCLILLSKQPLDEIIEIAKSPMVEAVADVSYQDRDKAKDARFRWDADRKLWVKELRHHHLETLSKDWNFNYHLNE